MIRSRYWLVNHLVLSSFALALLFGAGCSTGPSFTELRIEGQTQLLDSNIGVARRLFEEAHAKIPEHPYNLHDLGVCYAILARRHFEGGNHPAAMRDVDRAIEYYGRATSAHPGFQSALLGKNRALELKGQFDEALAHADWASEFVGPSFRQQAFLARELEERGDLDAALVRFRQGVAMENENPTAHAELARFLLRHHRQEEALEHLQAAYRLNPLEPGVLGTLVDLGAELPSAREPEPAALAEN